MEAIAIAKAAALKKLHEAKMATQNATNTEMNSSANENNQDAAPVEENYLQMQYLQKIRFQMLIQEATMILKIRLKKIILKETAQKNTL